MNTHFDINEHGCRDFPKESQLELVRAMARSQIVWSWGAHAWANVYDKGLRF